MPFGPQKNIKTDFGAVGDGVLITTPLSITSGTKNLSATINLWSAGDVGKRIIIDGGGSGVAGTYDTKIDAFTDAQHITLHDACTTTLISSTQTVGWGTDDSAAFTAANTFAQGQLPLGMDLLIPSGVYMLNGATPNINNWCRFIPLLKVTGQSNPILIGNVTLGSGLTIPNDTVPLINQANSGDSVLSLKSLSDVSRITPGHVINNSDGTVFTSGSKALLMAIDMQGFGNPQNPWYWEYVTITGVNPATGVISLSSSILNTYKTQYPQFVAGSAFNPGLGGPASICPIDASWIANQQFIGMQFWVPSQAINGSCQNITFTNCKWLSQFGPNPSFCDTWTADNCDFTANGNGFIEIDKVINNLIFKNNTIIHSLAFQSSSIINAIFNNVTVQNLFTGTARNTTITNSVINSLTIGPSAYGRCDTFTAINSSFSSISAVGATFQDITNTGFSLNNGTLQWALNNGPVRLAVPGTFVMFQGTSESETGFVLNDLMTDGVNSLMPTTLVGNTFPNVPRQGGTRLDMMAHPCPLFNMSNCTGCPDALDLSQLGAQNKPIYQYTNRTYTGNTLNSPPSVHIWGRIVSVKVNVSKPYTGIGGTLILNLFGQFLTGALDPNNSQTSWLPSVNLNIAGIRVITATLVTGLQTGDTLLVPGLIWFDGPQTPFRSFDISGESSSVWPIVSIEVNTDQGVPVPLPPVQNTFGGKSWFKEQQDLHKIQDLSKSAIELGRAGGNARARALTANQRSNISRNAANARWK